MYPLCFQPSACEALVQPGVLFVLEFAGCVMVGLFTSVVKTLMHRSVLCRQGKILHVR